MKFYRIEDGYYVANILAITGASMIVKDNGYVTMGHLSADVIGNPGDFRSEVLNLLSTTIDKLNGSLDLMVWHEGQTNYGMDMMVGAVDSTYSQIDMVNELRSIIISQSQGKGSTP